MDQNQEAVVEPKEPTAPLAPEKKGSKILKEIRSIAIILIVVLGFRSIILEPFRIPSGSMIPTLMIGDFILVNKFTYGLKVPFSDWFSDPIYIFERERPKRGDVIVFKYPENPSLNYIKRVVGAPGDEIEIRQKVVYVNGAPVEMEELSQEQSKMLIADMDDKFKNHALKFYTTKDGEHGHIIMEDEENYYKSDFSKIIVPADQYFVLGDNRDFSLDSRFWGFVPFENIKGSAIMVWFSLILPFDEPDVKFRPWRIGTMID